MGILTERIIAQSPQGFFPPKALAAIEKDVLAVAPHLASQSALVGLTLGTRVIQPQSRPGPVKVLTVRDEQWAGLGYCLKFVQHDSEPNVVLAASRQEAGPRVLSIQENNCYSSILEQFYPQDWNFNVGVQSVGRKDWGTEVATLVIKMFDWQTRRLLIHGDFINDHIFMIPTARGEELRLIDWGSGNLIRFAQLDRWFIAVANGLQIYFNLRPVEDQFLTTLEEAERSEPRFVKIGLSREFEIAFMGIHRRNAELRAAFPGQS